MNPAGGIDIYLLAGVRTWPSFLQPFGSRLTERFQQEGCRDATVRIVYPYGDYTRGLLRQIREVKRDLSGRKPGGAWIGGMAAAHAVRLGSAANRSVLLIGHSGGGVAACNAARLLLREGAVAHCRVVQIGSPKVRIHPDMRGLVGYFYSVDARGRRSDTVTRLGGWGGFRLTAGGWPVWDRRLHAPGHIGTIRIVGGHPDYFRSGPPFMLGQESNLQRTLDAVWNWVWKSIGEDDSP